MSNHTTICIRNDLHERLKEKTNTLGGNNVKKESFSDAIEKALDDQLRYQKKKVAKKE